MDISASEAGDLGHGSLLVCFQRHLARVVIDPDLREAGGRKPLPSNDEASR
jgi:hypothetical protein